MFTVYILHSTIRNRYYVGCSENVERRLSEHNSGKVSSTKAYLPWQIIYKEDFENVGEAYKREKEIKSYKGGYKFKELIKRRVGRVVECGGLENR